MKKTPTFIETKDSITFTKSFPLFKAYQWIAKAVSLEPAITVLTHVLVDNGSVVAADKVRLHRLVVGEMESLLVDGWYLVNSKKDSITFTPVEAAGVYPDYEKVISDSKKGLDHTVLYEARGDTKSLLGLAYHVLLEDLRPDQYQKAIVLDDDYLGDALGKGTLLSNKKDRVKWTLRNRDAYRELVMRGELPRSYGTAYVEALVMPLK